jgi:hypothetical protein
MIMSFGVLTWSATWNWDIGVHASDTGASGGNTAAWLWFFSSFAVFVVSLSAVVVVGARSRAGPEVRASRP